MATTFIGTAKLFIALGPPFREATLSTCVSKRLLGNPWLAEFLVLGVAVQSGDLDRDFGFLPVGVMRKNEEKEVNMSRNRCDDPHQISFFFGSY